MQGQILNTFFPAALACVLSSVAACTLLSQMIVLARIEVSGRTSSFRGSRDIAWKW